LDAFAKTTSCAGQPRRLSDPRRDSNYSIGMAVADVVIDPPSMPGTPEGWQSQ
jgi:hypothetical protein